VRQYQTFVDKRLLGPCAFCGGRPDTRDHVPPKVFLDKPYPTNLPVVASCAGCNIGASLDEEFLAALLEVVVCGTANAADLRREGVARALKHSPALAALLARGLTDRGFALSARHAERVSRVLEKIGRALWALEIGEPSGDLGAAVTWQPWPTLTSEQRKAFLTIDPFPLLPEVGSRMLTRWAEEQSTWVEVQPERFSYLIETLGRVRMLLRGSPAAVIELLPPD